MTIIVGVIRSQIFSRGFRTLSILNARSRQPNRNATSGNKSSDKLDIDYEFYDAVEDLSNTLITDTSRSLAETLTRDHKSVREKVKAQILYKKMFKGPPESSILSYRAREQISHLSLTDPSEWTADTISEFFPISKRGAYAFLRKQSRNPYRVFRSLDRVISFDTEAIKHWLLIIETICMAQVIELVKPEESQVRQVLSTQLPTELQWTGIENILPRLPFVDGNPNLPFPPQTSLDAYKFAKSTHKPGYFQQIAETFYKPTDADEKSLSIRRQQEQVISKLVSFFKCMDFSVFTKPLTEDSSLTFKTLCRDWLTVDPNAPLLESPKLPKINHKVDCNFSKLFRFKRDLSIGSGVDDPSQPTPNDHDSRNSTISRMGLQATSQYFSVLPPIVTFSHQEIGPAVKTQGDKQNPKLKIQDQVNSGVNQNQSPAKDLGNVKDRRRPIRFSSSSNSPPSTTAAFKRRHFQDNLNCNFRREPFVCEMCSERFTSKQRFSRHKLLHTGGGMAYTCEECKKTYTRPTDRAKCMLKHRQRDVAEQSTNPNPSPSKKAPTKIPIFPVNGPHICPLCPDKRSYKFDSSLRKHLRLYHPNYKRKAVAIQREQEQEKQNGETASDQPQRPSSGETCVVNYSLKTSEIAVSIANPMTQLPITVNAPATAYLLPSGELLFTLDTQYTQGDQYYHVVETDEAINQRQPLCMEVEAAETSATATGLGGVEEWRTSQPAHEAVVAYAVATDVPNAIHQTHSLPVDLCTSALCLTVTDPFSNSASQQPAVISVDPSTYQTIPSVADEGALDLTELPHEVIDLSSQVNPVDLSGTHPQHPRSELWESDSLFSYTHFLNGDDAL